MSRPTHSTYRSRTAAWVGRRSHAFTLVELLVVLAVIALLAALLMPVIVGARDQGARIACLSNLRQLYGAVSLYAADCSGSLPPYHNEVGARHSEGHGFPAVDVPAHGDQWVAALQPYVRNSGIWFCPADRFARKIVPLDRSRLSTIDHQYSSYLTGMGLLEHIARRSPMTMDGYHSTKEPPQPSVSVLLTDNLWGLMTDRTVYPDYSHRGSFNYLFFDGHVRTYRQHDPECPFGL